MSKAAFKGGALDGCSFTPEQLNTIGRIHGIPFPDKGYTRIYVLMPSLAECERILRGEINKDSIQGNLHPYEQVQLPGGVIEFHEGSASLDAATRGIG